MLGWFYMRSILLLRMTRLLWFHGFRRPWGRRCTRFFVTLLFSCWVILKSLFTMSINRQTLLSTGLRPMLLNTREMFCGLTWKMLRVNFVIFFFLTFLDIFILEWYSWMLRLIKKKKIVLILFSVSEKCIVDPFRCALLCRHCSNLFVGICKWVICMFRTSWQGQFKLICVDLWLTPWHHDKRCRYSFHKWPLS